MHTRLCPVMLGIVTNLSRRRRGGGGGKKAAVKEAGERRLL